MMATKKTYEDAFNVVENSYKEFLSTRLINENNNRRHWDKLISDLLETLGWTVADFYAEMDKRRLEKRFKRRREEEHAILNTRAKLEAREKEII